MRLKELEKFDNIYIQCHDYPDADAIASAYGLFCYFKEKNKSVKIIYSGRSRIKKANIVLMLDKLNIKVKYIEPHKAETMEGIGLLITCDCQYGAGNVTKIPAENIAVIDHHQLEIEEMKYMHVLSDMGSCSTVVWRMLKKEGYTVTDDNNLATALYYGLLTDTNNFMEVHNPVDRDMHDELPANTSLVNLFCNSNISLEELEIAGVAMIRYSFNEQYNYAVIRSQPCDPNILGLISDFMLQVDKVYSCIVYNEIDAGFKLSVRSCVREIDASELAAYLTDKIGSGGGHYQKAGGFISRKLYEDAFGYLNSDAYFNSRMNEYFMSHELIYADKYKPDIDTFTKCIKKKLPVGYVRTSELLPVGTPIMIRTMEGDMDLIVQEDLILIIGIMGEVYPNKLEKFDRSYVLSEEPYNFEKMTLVNKYSPVMKNRLDGKVWSLAEHAHTCVPSGEIIVYVKPLEKRAKVFTSWDKNRYMVGGIGDMIATRADDMQDFYVINKDVFERTYDVIM